MSPYIADPDQWMTEPEQTCPGCGSEGNRRVKISLECPRYIVNGHMAACIGCGNAVHFECQTPDEGGDLLDPGCGWWFQYPLHPHASNYPSMGRAPAWDYKRYQL